MLRRGNRDLPYDPPKNGRQVREPWNGQIIIEGSRGRLRTQRLVSCQDQSSHLGTIFTAATVNREAFFVRFLCEGQPQRIGHETEAIKRKTSDTSLTLAAALMALYQQRYRLYSRDQNVGVHCTAMFYVEGDERLAAERTEAISHKSAHDFFESPRGVHIVFRYRYDDVQRLDLHERVIFVESVERLSPAHLKCVLTLRR